MLALGRSITGVTWDAVAQMKAWRAQENALVDQRDTIKLLQQNSKAAADAVCSFSDEELDMAATVRRIRL